MSKQKISPVTSIEVSHSVQQVDVHIKVPFALPDPPTPPTLLTSHDSGSKVPAALALRPAYRLSAARWEFLRSLPIYNGAVIASTTKSEARLTHDDLRLFVGRAAFRDHGIGPHDAVAIVMPNGAELAVAVICCIAWAVAVPLDPSLKADDMEAAFRHMKVAHVLALRRHKVYDDHIVSSCDGVGAKLHYLVNDAKKAGTYFWAENNAGLGSQWANGKDAQAGFAGYGCSEEGGFDDNALLLRTSGTTSKPKIVPLTVRGLLMGASSIASGLGIGQNDICLNVMPLTHIGGISCSLLSTVVSGGCVICAPGFDPWNFYGYLTDFRPTWYYAVPTIHRAVRLACPAAGPPSTALRLIRSGADALSHEDAKALSALFGCRVIPTYSMSECMPVCQPPQDYALSKPGSVGLPIGCSLRIASPDGHALPYDQEGEVCVSGDVVTSGYVENLDANSESFFDDGGKRWFRTGDLGRLDGEGYVFLTGRAKELIKRGGEQICPHEIEEVFSRHPAVKLALAFPVPNAFWGEEVAVAVVLREGVEISSKASASNSAFAKTMSKLPSILPKAPKKVTGTNVGSTSSSEMTTTLSKVSAVLSGLSSNTPSNNSEQTITLRNQSLNHSKLDHVSSIRSRQVEKQPSDDSRTVTAETLLAFTAHSLAPHKVPRQIRFATEEDLPRTATGKYKRRGLHEHLGVEPLDLKDEATLLEPISVAENAPPPVKPNPAIYGIRYLASLWVVFIHVGTFPHPIKAWRNISITMPTFFILAGFLLESSTTREITDHKRFFRNRFIASHPIYLMSSLFAYPAFILTLKDDLGIEMATAVGTLFLCLSLFGLGLLLNGPSWFMHIYYPCVALFPYINKALNKSRIFNVLKNPTAPCCTCLDYLCGIKCIGYVAYPLAAWISVITAFNAIVFSLLLVFGGVMVAYALGYLLGFPLWLGLFVCGMLTFRVFEHHHRGADTAEHAWRHWGKMTDFISLSFVGMLAIQSYLSEGPVNWETMELDMRDTGVGSCSNYISCSYSTCTDPSWDDYDCYSNLCYHGRADAACAEAPDGFNLTDDAICLHGLRSFKCGAGAASVFVDYQSVPTNTMVAMLSSRPFRFGTPIICLYIYGLAVGHGITARVLGCNFMVKWLAPAAYPLYLFHWPLFSYWRLLRDFVGVNRDVEKDGTDPTPWWEFLMFLPVVTALALFVAHVLNSHATVLFMNLFDHLYCCCPCICGMQGRLTDEGGQNALFTLLDVVSGLTGADVDGTTLISHLGLDSFGASALVGILGSRVPDVKLKAADVYELETIGDIAALIERRRCENKGKIVGSPVQSEV